jgi:hypothetical protein
LYEQVWNRVIVLATGIALGWNLVNYWAVPLVEVPRQRNRMIASGVVALGMVLWLGTQALDAAVTAILIIGSVALVSFAANAKQKNRVPDDELFPTLQPPAVRQERPVLLLIGYGEPARYTGPEPWAAWLAEAKERGEQAPHWFLQPRAYARVRSTYAQMDAAPLVQALDGLREDLARQCKDRDASPSAIEPLIWTTPGAFIRRLIHLANEGHRSLLLLPLNPREADLVALREAVTRSRVREVGVQIEILDPPTDRWPDPDPDERMRRILQGQPASPPPPPPSETVRQLTERIIEGMSIS